jgi:hypothetical protein
MQRESTSKRLYQMTKPFPLDPYPNGHIKPSIPDEYDEYEEED